MTTYSELRDLTVSLTARPDLAKEHAIAITGAVRKFHLADTWAQDMDVLVLDMATYPTSDFRWRLDLNSSQLNRFRKLYKATILDVTQQVTSFQGLPSMPPDYLDLGKGTDVPIVSPADLVDENGSDRPQYIYHAGNVLQIKLQHLGTKLELQYFMHPNIDRSNGSITINSWIADSMPEAVAQEAAGAVFKMIGKDEEAQLHRQLFAENLVMLRMTAVGASGM